MGHYDEPELEYGEGYYEYGDHGDSYGDRYGDEERHDRDHEEYDEGGLDDNPFAICADWDRDSVMYHCLERTNGVCEPVKSRCQVVDQYCEHGEDEEMCNDSPDTCKWEHGKCHGTGYLAEHGNMFDHDEYMNDVKEDGDVAVGMLTEDGSMTNFIYMAIVCVVFFGVGWVFANYGRKGASFKMSDYQTMEMVETN